MTLKTNQRESDQVVGVCLAPEYPSVAGWCVWLDTAREDFPRPSPLSDVALGGWVPNPQTQLCLSFILSLQDLSRCSALRAGACQAN